LNICDLVVSPIQQGSHLMFRNSRRPSSYALPQDNTKCIWPWLGSSAEHLIVFVALSVSVFSWWDHRTRHPAVNTFTWKRVESES